MSEYIEVGQPLQFTDPNTPTRVGEIVENVSDIYNIPSPRLGMQVFVKSEKKSFVITSLKSKVIGGVDVPEAAVEAFESVGAKSITWNNDTAPSNMNDFVVAGIYDIKGEHTRIDDNLPFGNTGSGHTFHARLEVLDSSIAPGGQSDDICITQKLTLSNRVAGDGDVYIRTGRGTSKEAITWETWGKLQQNIEVGQVATLDNLIDNGIYSGVYKYGSGQYDYETFVLVVINDYAIDGANRKISQFKYALSLTGEVSYKSRLYSIKAGEDFARWDSNWLDINEANINKAIQDAIAKVVGTAPDTLDTLQEIAGWVKSHEDLYATLKALAEDNTRNINEETERAQNAEKEIKNNAMQYDTLGVSIYADKAEIYGRSINTDVRVVEFPTATTEKAGVMSAEDKRTVEDVSMKTKHIHATEADDTIEEIVICNNDETEEIVKINNEGLAAKKIFNLDGEELKPSGLHSIADNHATLEICDEKQQPILTIDFNGNLNTASFNSLNVAKNKFNGKTMLYIGGSISTGNIWHWKGYIKDCIGLDYVDYNISDTVNVTPAVGGITIRPHNDDDTRPMNAGAAEVGSGAKSIWWRCCNKRLGIYDFDYINLFGGTNDIYDDNLNVGTIDDTPLLDTDVEDLSALDLSRVSFASAFMGCIEMLQRDFPSKPIFICTLLYNGYAKTPDVVKIQMLAAQKYGLKVVPFYYSELNSQNYQWLCDGFHPNQVAARIMEKNFIEYINL